MASSPLVAIAATPSDGSIEELLAVTKVQDLVDSTFLTVERQLRQAIQQAVAGKDVSADQQRTLNGSMQKFVASMRAEFNWDVVRPMYVQAYKETFDQAEIDGMVAFYKTPAGQAYATKLPQLSQKMTAAAQSRLQPILQRMRPALQAALVDAGIR
jgi:hypothetical protein